MTPNKRDLKAYARFDGTGRIVPGSLILRRNKPKNGNWKETQAYECCNPSGCSIPITVKLRYSVVECDELSSEANYLILACNGQLTINTTTNEPVPNGYYYTNSLNGIRAYIVENSIITSFVTICA